MGFQLATSHCQLTTAVAHSLTNWETHAFAPRPQGRRKLALGARRGRGIESKVKKIKSSLEKRKGGSGCALLKKGNGAAPRPVAEEGGA